jgi:glycosyltransferase involved in cell wall biosynthesis
VKHFPLLRRILDKHINGPVIRRTEKNLLACGRILSLSDYTAKILGDIAGPRFHKEILPVPVDAELFAPKQSSLVPARLGFAGRFNDPRKNIGLLLQAAAQLRQAFPQVSVILMGDTAQPGVMQTIAALGLQDHVTIKSGLSREQMRDCLQTLDVFVLPSHQEGLCISALEAMACGVPVVSTRCGGPEEFVVPAVTGSLVGFEPREMTDAIARILADRDVRARMSAAARSLVEDRYANARADAVFAQAFKATFPKLGIHRAPPELTHPALATNAAA